MPGSKSLVVRIEKCWVGPILVTNMYSKHLRSLYYMLKKYRMEEMDEIKPPFRIKSLQIIDSTEKVVHCRRMHESGWEDVQLYVILIQLTTEGTGWYLKRWRDDYILRHLERLRKIETKEGG